MTTIAKQLRWIIGWRPYAIVFLLWALLYLPYLRSSPGWYGDETLTHHTSRNLVSGKATNMALWNTFWHPHYPYQPGYSLVDGVFATLFNRDILGSRFFNALLALASAFAILGWGKYSFGFKASFFAALMLLTYGQSVVHFRLVYAHNAAGLGFLIMTLHLLRPVCARNDWKAGWGLMIAAASHPLFIHGALGLGLCRIKNPRSWIRLFLPAALCVSLSLLMAYYFFGSWLLEDLVHLKETYSHGGKALTGWQSLDSIACFVFQDWFHVGIFLGVFTSILMRKYVLPVICLLVVFLLVRNRQNLTFFYYQAMVILPCLCLGWAVLWKFLETRIKKEIPVARAALMVLLLLPLMQLAQALPLVLSGKIKPRANYYFTQSTDQIEAAARWLNERTTNGDVVAGNANIAWLLNAETVPYLQLITWYGFPTQGYENGNRRERFRFNAALENCRYAVIGDIDRRWTTGEPNVRILFDRMEKEGWPVVWQSEFYTILQNPSWHP